MSTPEDTWEQTEARIRGLLDKLKDGLAGVQADLAGWREQIHDIEIRLAVSDALVRQARELHPSTVETGTGLCLDQYAGRTCMQPLGHDGPHGPRVSDGPQIIWCTSTNEGRLCVKPFGHLGSHKWGTP